MIGSVNVSKQDTLNEKVDSSFREFSLASMFLDQQTK